ncbi:MAG: hypothetical protein E6J42_04705 [Chloroflexi bacterium]|nr:MAG: hypothetical protein E6J42_04705 [Chloroflexota bacterium]
MERRRRPPRPRSAPRRRGWVPTPRATRRPGTRPTPRRLSARRGGSCQRRQPRQASPDDEPE